MNIKEIVNQEALALQAVFSSVSRGDDTVRSMLQTCLDAESSLPQELEKIRSIPTDSDLDRLVADFYYDLTNWQVTHAAKIARKRLDYLDYLSETGSYKQEMDKCRKDTVHWFKYWAWTYDPRSDSPIQDFPFDPFEYQSNLINWLERQVFLYRKGGVVEKSRDMGASWVICDWNVKQFLFNPGYSALIGSRKEDYVDKKGDMGTLFEKCRYQLRLLPLWMLPDGFDPLDDKSMPFMKLVNPKNKAMLVGESSNPNYGRGGRFTATFQDEFAFFPSGGTEAYASLSQSARSNFFISTPNGKQNKFAELRFSGSYPVFTIHWKQHPWKDDRWLQIERTKMNSAEIAQEIELDYEASLSGRIFSEWDEKYHVITWGEFVQFFGKMATDDNGLPCIPKHWQLGRALDWGTTLEHPTAAVWCSVPSEIDPLNNCVFVYREMVLPIKGKEEPITPRRIGDKIYELQKPWENSQSNSKFSISIMSHEASSELDAFQLDMPPSRKLAFSKWTPSMTDGIGVLQNYLQLDPNVPHPFRPHLDGEKHKGSPKIFFIVDDNQGDLIYDDLGRCLVTGAVDDNGLWRLRAEIPAYHYPKTATGVEQNKPYPLFNDAIDALRKLASHWFPPPSPATAKQLLERRLPENLRESTILNPESHLSRDTMAQRWLTRQVYIREHDLDVLDSPSHWRDRLYQGKKDY